MQQILLKVFAVCRYKTNPNEPIFSNISRF